MSKFSPFRKNNASSKRQVSPNYSPYNQNSRLVDKSRVGKSIISDFQPRTYQKNDEQQHKLTQKKRYDPLMNIDVENLIDKNKYLVAQNGQLYLMLEERGRIITILEKKLEDHMQREVRTLQSIERQKNMFLNESNKKFQQYQYKIESLMAEICRLSNQNYQRGLINGKIAKQNHDNLVALVHTQATVKDLSEIQKMKVKNIIEMKNNQMDELICQFRQHSDKLKNEILNLNNQILHLNHIRKMQLSQQKLMYEGMMDGMCRQYQKQRGLLVLQGQLQIKRLQNIIDSKENEREKIKQEKKITEIEKDTRERQLIERKNKLESDILAMQQQFKKINFDQTQRLKQLNKNQIEALQTGNDAIVYNLKNENNNLMSLNNLKSQQLQKLYEQMAAQRQQHASQVQDLETVIKDLKQKMSKMEGQYTLELESLKVKWAELRQADLTAFKEYFQHEVKVLNNHLFESNKESEENRNKLHQELNEKNQMRKGFQIQKIKLQTKISELETKLAEVMMVSRQETSNIENKIKLTSQMLLRQSIEKEKYTQFSEEQKKKLQELIKAKDKQIQGLGQKLKILKQNNQKEINQKNFEISTITKNKDDIEMQMKKQKYFYQNELKKKQMVLKSNKEMSDAEIDRLKKAHKEQYQSAVKDLEIEKINLEVELQKYKNSQKQLTEELKILNHQKIETFNENKNAQSDQKNKLIEMNKKNEERIIKQYEQQISRLNNDLSDIKLQLKYKEQDLRTSNERYHRLEQKMDMLMDSQEKLKNMENKILALGQENNVVKNLAEIIKSKKK